MSLQNINTIQEEAFNAYNRVPQSEAAGWAQVIAQCEIAYHLARIATQLEDGKIAILEGENIVERLSRIGTAVEMLERQ